MSTISDALVGAYYVKGIIGNIKMVGAPIVHFALIVVPSTHKVTGTVQITQAVLGGGYTGTVEGIIYSTGLGEVTQIIGLKGTIHPNEPETYELAFDAHMAVNQAWKGTGGFNYGSVHIENAPVIPEKNK